jgi:maltose alpha-D-glucosyltransferase / alpha-amylase
LKQPGSAADPLWYKDAIIYELHVKAFMDSNNDGIGDFQGLLGKLDYLQDLGARWRTSGSSWSRRTTVACKS